MDGLRRRSRWVRLNKPRVINEVSTSSTTDICRSFLAKDLVLGGLGARADDHQVDVDVRRPGGAPGDAVGDVVGDQRVRRRRRRPRRPLLLRRRGTGSARTPRSRTMPGAISVTRTGWPMSSSRSVSVSAGDAVLGRGVAAAALVDDAAGRRAHDDDVPAPLATSAGSSAWVTCSVPMHVDLVHRPPVVGVGLGDGSSAERAAGVVDQHVAARAADLGRERGDRRVVGDVAGRPRCRRSRRRSASSRSARRAAQTTSKPSARQAAGGGRADAAAGPGDDRGPRSCRPILPRIAHARVRRTESGRIGDGIGPGRARPAADRRSEVRMTCVLPAAPPRAPPRGHAQRAHLARSTSPGTGDAGGMNVYVVELSRRLAAAGHRGRDLHPRHPGDLPPRRRAGARRHRPPRRRRAVRGAGQGRPAGPAVRVHPRRAAGRGGARAGLLRPRPLALLAVRPGRLRWPRERWGVPLVHSMHTMAKVKNAALADGRHPRAGRPR